MSTHASDGRFEFSFSTAPRRAPASSESGDGVFTILLATDLSGRTARGIRHPVAGRKPTRVSIDNLEPVLADLDVSVTTEDPGHPGQVVSLPVSSIDDLHPDAVVRRVPGISTLLQSWLALRTADAAAAASRLQMLLNPQVPSAPSAPSTPEPAKAPARETDVDTLSRLLGGTPATPAAKAPGAGFDPQTVIRNIVSGSSSQVAAAPAGSAGLASAAALELSARLRAVLGHPDFVAIERAWRSVDMLIRHNPDEDCARICLLDISVDELAADPAGFARVVRDSGCHAVLIDKIFGQQESDLKQLAELVGALAALPTSILAGAAPAMVGSDGFDRHPDPDDWQSPSPELAQAWQTLQATPGADHLALFLPRFLLRQPYGQAGDPIESFSFEELPSPAPHERFCWGNAAYLAAQSLAAAAASGEGVPEMHGCGDIDDLPLARYLEHGGTAIKPATEAWLVDRAVDRLLANGLSVVQGTRNNTTARVFFRTAATAE